MAECITRRKIPRCRTKRAAARQRERYLASPPSGTSQPSPRERADSDGRGELSCRCRSPVLSWSSGSPADGGCGFLGGISALPAATTAEDGGQTRDHAAGGGARGRSEGERAGRGGVVGRS